MAKSSFDSPEWSTARIGSPPIAADQPHADELAPGVNVTQYKQFEIVDRLGEGGMGRIYKAYDPSMDRYIALKVLKSDVPESERRRFQKEATISANFSHPGLIRVLEIGQSGDLEWMAMEYLRGRDISKIVRRDRATPFRVVVDIFSQVLDALAYIHLRQIAHCDIKPENIFVTRDNYDRRLIIVKLIDFGIARQLNGPLELHTHLTGDPRYMAPEQAILNNPFDHRVDLYALGLSFYEAATGQHPFQDWFHLTPIELLDVQAKREPEPPSLHMPTSTPPALNQHLNEFIAKACAKDPDQRFQNAADMKADLQSMLDDIEAQQTD